MEFWKPLTILNCYILLLSFKKTNEASDIRQKLDSLMITIGFPQLRLFGCAAARGENLEQALEYIDEV